MKPYASYKPSGVPWLGDVPAHWEVNTIKRGYEITLGKMLQTERKASTDVSAPYLRSANVQSEKVDVSDVQAMWFTEHEVQQLALEPNDLVVCEGGDAGRSAIWHGEIDGCYFQNSVNRVRGVGNNTTFYLMRWLGVVKSCGYMDIVCNKATIAHLTKEKLANLPMLFPPPDEQQAIADFLDVETARIDTLIHEKDELIGLLREWRQSVVAEAVTKGLDKTIAMKPSGVPWLGDVPAHWAVEKLKFFVGFAGGGTPSKDNPAYWEGAIPWVSPKDMKRPRISETEDYITEEGQLNSPCVLIPPMSVLTVVRSGILQHSIPVALNVVPVALNQDMKALLLSERADCRFLAYEISGCQKELREAWVKQGATVESIEHQRMADSQLALPPLQEQQAIADYLDTETAKIDDLIAHTHDEIALLKELRAATIADAVLGRIDVRGSAKTIAACA